MKRLYIYWLEGTLEPYMVISEKLHLSSWLDERTPPNKNNNSNI